MESNYYIYCISGQIGELPVGLKGFEDRDVIILPYKDICAVISPTDVTHYDAAFENLECHEKVANAVMDTGSILPMKFSTILKSTDDVKKLLLKYYCQFEANLNKIQGKIELGIKIFYKIDALIKDEPKAGYSGKEYFLKKYNEYLENKNRLEPYLNMAGEIHNKLSRLSCENCLSNPLKNNLIMNASYLVQRDIVDTFSEKVKLIKEEYNIFKIVYSGPWPPYHFVKVKEVGDEGE